MPQQDFNAAERQAIMRAREMYSRAMPVQNADPVFHKQPNRPATEHSAHQNSNHQPPLPPRQENKNPRQGFNPSGDGGDTLLLMALMYIML